MEYRLLVDFGVIEFLESLGQADRRALRNCFLEIKNYPSRYSDFKEEDSQGRLVDIHIFGKYAIKYWEDVSDRDLKIIDVHYADRARR